MHCPRCGEILHEFEPSPRWLRFFRCEGCWLDWHLVGSILEPGKRAVDLVSTPPQFVNLSLLDANRPKFRYSERRRAFYRVQGTGISGNQRF